MKRLVSAALLALLILCLLAPCAAADGVLDDRTGRVGLGEAERGAGEASLPLTEDAEDEGKGHR